MSSTQQLLLGEGAGGSAPVYIEDVFSTYLYTGNGSTQTITNGIDLSANGGLTWIKQRSATRDNLLFDTVRGATQRLFSNLTSAQSVDASSLTAFNSTGFSIGSDSGVNINAGTYVSWTFREQTKFFDVVTYTGTGSATTIAHNLGSTPGCIIVKTVNDVDNWAVYHRSLANNQWLSINTTEAVKTSTTVWNNTAPTSSVFSVGTAGVTNGSGQTYVAYLFAHNAGGFGLTGTDNVISCGSFTTDINGDFSPVTLGYEPQWLMFKSSSGTDNWVMLDIMRGIPTGTEDAELKANLNSAETSVTRRVDVTSTGFKRDGTLDASATYIYIAIRRGPMKVPTSATTVFNPDYAWNTSSSIMGYLGQPTDAFWLGYLSGNAVSVNTRTRLVGGNRLTTSSTSAEVVDATTTYWDSQLGFQTGGSLTTSLITWNFRRAPSFMDVVCYTGTGSTQTIAHNLGVAPELYIVKQRSSAQGWCVGSSYIANTGKLALQTDSEVFTDSTAWNSTYPTSSVLTVGSLANTNENAKNFVAYLFATCAGVSKVGSYTGTGALQTVNCGFTSGARFVFIKRTDSTGGWFTYDSVRGITGSDDPYLLLNSSAAQVTNTNYVDTTAVGFQVTAAAPADINANGGTYIFLAIA